MAESWSLADADAHGTVRWHSGLETTAGSLCHGAAQSSRTRPSPASLVQLLAWRAGMEPWGTGGRAWRMGSGIDLRLALAPIKALSGKNVTKGHDFTALGGAQSFGIHSMSF